MRIMESRAFEGSPTLRPEMLSSQFGEIPPSESAFYKYDM
jgi:hypothetical protein